MNTKEENRKSVKNILELLSSREQQMAYQVKVPMANVALELLCLWFDDLHHPGSQLFRYSFNKTELKLLDEFNSYYDKRTGLLPETIEQLHQNEQWRIIMKEAKRVLEEIS